MIGGIVSPDTPGISTVWCLLMRDPLTKCPTKPTHHHRMNDYSLCDVKLNGGLPTIMTAPYITQPFTINEFTLGHTCNMYYLEHHRLNEKKVKYKQITKLTLSDLTEEDSHSTHNFGPSDGRLKACTKSNMLWATL